MTEQELRRIKLRAKHVTAVYVSQWVGPGTAQDRQLFETVTVTDIDALIAEVRRLRGVVEELHRTYDPLDYCENHKDDCHGYCRRCDKWKYRSDKEATNDN